MNDTHTLPLHASETLVLPATELFVETHAAAELPAHQNDNPQPIADDGTQASIAEIVFLFEGIQTAARTTLDRAIRIGELLLKLKKDGHRHGRWLEFVERHLPFPERRAQQYMQLFKRRDELKSATVSDLGVGEALRLVAHRTEKSETPPAPSEDDERAKKVELITSISRLAIERLETLEVSRIEEFKTSMLKFRQEWFTRHAPEQLAPKRLITKGGAE